MLHTQTKEFKNPVLVAAGDILDSTPDGKLLSFSGSIGKPLVPESLAMEATIDAAAIAIADALESMKSVGVLSANRAANVEIQDLTYSAIPEGAAGEQITISYNAGETAGAETVTVAGMAITVGIEDGVSTADQIKTAIDADVEANLLVTVAVSGTGGTAQITVGATGLAGGVADTTATGILTFGQNAGNGETVTIGTNSEKVYTFQDSLTEVDGNVHIGVDADASLTNLMNAINNVGGGSQGTDYANAMEDNFSVSAAEGALDTLDLTALLPGVFGNSIDLSTNVTNASVSGANLSGGTGVGAVNDITFTGQPSNLETIVINGKTYKWEDSLTDFDGNVKIEVSAADCVRNLVNAITLRDSNSNAYYAASMTLHPTVWAEDGTGTVIDLTAKTPGTPGNAFTLVTSASNTSVSGATFTTGEYAVQAVLIEQDVTYTAVDHGTSGNAITVEYVLGGTAGSERVTVSSNAIEVQIEYGVTDADDIIAAVNGDGDAAALVTASVSGTGGTVQEDVSAVPLIAGAEITGTIDYLTGDWTLVFTTPPDNSSDITAAYSYLLEGANDVNNQLLTQDGFDERLSIIKVENLSTTNVSFMFFGSNDLGVNWIPIQKSAGIVKPNSRMIVPWSVDFSMIKITGTGGRLRLSGS